MNAFRKYSGWYWLVVAALLLAQYSLSRLGLYIYSPKSYVLIALIIAATIFVTVTNIIKDKS
jgi:hypothetical protein